MHEHNSIVSQSPAIQPASKAATFNQQTVKENIYTENFYHFPLQRKLSIGAVDDPLEDEADNMADKVMRMPEQNFIQRKCAHCEEEERAQRKPLASFIQKKCAACEEEERAQRKPLASFIQKKQSSTNNNAVASDSVSNQIQSTKGSGNVMSDTTKSFMESRFGTDFSNVKIHSDGNSSQLSNDLNAQAFTVGSDIYFNEGKYQPESSDGKYLLAHELTHAIQQSDKVNKKIMRTPRSLTEQLDVSRLSLSELENEEYELNKYLQDQIEGTPETDQLFGELDGIRTEIAKQKKQERHPSKRRKYTQPRSLRECISFEDINDSDLSDELNLIHAALSTKLKRADRRKLLIARASFETERAKRRGVAEAVERADKVRKAFTPSINKTDAEGLIEIMNRIDKIRPAETYPGLLAVLTSDKVIYITTDEYVQIITSIKKLFRDNITKIKSNGEMAEEGYKIQKDIDEDCWVTSFWVQTLGGIDDPGDKLYADTDKMRGYIIKAKSRIAKNQFSEAAQAVAKANEYSVEANLLYQNFHENIISTGETIVGVLEWTRNISLGAAAIIGAIVAAPIIIAGVGEAAAGLSALGGRAVLSVALATGTPVAADVAAPAAITALAEAPAAIAVATEGPAALAAVTEAPAALAAVTEAPAALATVADTAATTLPSIASQAPAALATVETTAAAETASSISTAAKATAAVSLTTLAGDGSSHKDEDQKKKCKSTGIPCASPLPILWPTELPLPTESPRILMRVSKDDLEWEGIERGKAQTEFASELAFWRNKGIGVPTDLTCFTEDSEPNVPLHAHHIHPMYLNGEDAHWNLCGREALSHLRGHARLDNQIEFAEEYKACGICQYQLSKHPFGQQYKIEGTK